MKQWQWQVYTTDPLKTLGHYQLVAVNLKREIVFSPGYTFEQVAQNICVDCEWQNWFNATMLVTM